MRSSAIEVVHLSTRFKIGTPLRLVNQSSFTRFMRHDREIAELLSRICALSESEGRLTGVLEFRGELASAIGKPNGGYLCYLLEQSESIAAIRLAIWMLGRKGGHYGTRTIATYVCHEEPAIRREAARALRRLKGWRQLRQMQDDADPRVRQFANPQVAGRRSPNGVPSFLGRSAAGVTPNKSTHEMQANATEDRRPLTIANSVSFADRKPPKSQRHVRLVLTRIQRWIRGIRSSV